MITYHKEYLRNEIGFIMGIVKSYMLYCIKGIDLIPPKKLMPSVLSIPEATVTRETKGGKVSYTSLFYLSEFSLT